MNHVLRFSLRFLMLCLLLGVFCSTGYANNATAPFPSPYPGMVCGNADCSIRWSEELGLKSLEEARGKLDSGAMDTDCIEMKLFDPSSAATDAQNVCTCIELIKYVTLHYESTPQYNWNRMRYAWVNCLALNYLTFAKFAQKNFLSSFVLDTNSPNHLSPRFGDIVNYETQKQRINAEQNEKSWMEFEPNIKMQRNDGHLEIISELYTSTLTELARGDFNNDGYQDILIRDETSANYGSGYDVRLFIITRKSLGESIQIVVEHQYYLDQVDK